MARFRLPLSGDVTQTINPWTWIFSPQASQFGLVNIDLGPSGDPDVEAEILSDIASYGRQIGRLQDVMGILIDRLEKSEVLAGSDKDAVEDFRALMRDIQRVKIRHANGKSEN